MNAFNLTRFTLASRKRQRGAALAISMFLMMVTTLLIVSAMRTSILEEKIAGNQRDQMMAFQAAEAALRGGEFWIGAQAQVPEATADGSSGVWTLDGADGGTGGAWWEQKGAIWWNNNAYTHGFTEALVNISAQPRFTLEEQQYIRDSLTLGRQHDEAGRQFYRVTSNATGGTDNANVMLQTTYSKRD